MHACMQVPTRASSTIRFGHRHGGVGETEMIAWYTTALAPCLLFRGRMHSTNSRVFGRELAELARGSPKKQYQARTAPWQHERKWGRDNGLYRYVYHRRYICRYEGPNPSDRLDRVIAYVVVLLINIEIYDNPTCARTKQSGALADATAQAPRQQSDIDD